MGSVRGDRDRVRDRKDARDVGIRQGGTGEADYFDHLPSLADRAFAIADRNGPTVPNASSPAGTLRNSFWGGLSGGETRRPPAQYLDGRRRPRQDESQGAAQKAVVKSPAGAMTVSPLASAQRDNGPGPPGIIRSTFLGKKGGGLMPVLRPSKPANLAAGPKPAYMDRAPRMPHGRPGSAGPPTTWPPSGSFGKGPSRLAMRWC